MAKEIYIGVNNIANKVKKIYVGVDGVAKKIKKVYVGDANGKARLCFSSASVPFISGSITCSNTRSIVVNNIGFTPTHAVLILGSNGGTSYYSDLYNGSLGRYYMSGMSYSSSSTATVDGESVTFKGSFVRNVSYTYYVWREEVQ